MFTNIINAKTLWVCIYNMMTLYCWNTFFDSLWWGICVSQVIKYNYVVSTVQKHCDKRLYNSLYLHEWTMLLICGTWLPMLISVQQLIHSVSWDTVLYNIYKYHGVRQLRTRGTGSVAAVQSVDEISYRTQYTHGSSPLSLTPLHMNCELSFS